MPIVEVEWGDSGCHSRWREVADTPNRPIACRTVGYLLARSREAVTVVLSQNEEGGIAEAMTIPTPTISRLTTLKAARRPAAGRPRRARGA